MKIVAEFLRERRRLCSMKMKEVCAELEARGMGINRKTLYGYENGVSEPRITVFLELCDIYGVTDVGEAFRSFKRTSNRCEEQRREYDT